MQHDALSLCFEGVNLNHRAEHDQIVRRMVTARHRRDLSAMAQRSARTTRLTPMAVNAMPATVTAVIGSSNRSHAMTAVQGGTR